MKVPFYFGLVRDQRAKGQEIDEQVLQIQRGCFILRLYHQVRGFGLHTGDIVFHTATVLEHGFGIWGGGLASMERKCL